MGYFRDIRQAIAEGSWIAPVSPDDRFLSAGDDPDTSLPAPDFSAIPYTELVADTLADAVRNYADAFKSCEHASALCEASPSEAALTEVRTACGASVRAFQHLCDVDSHVTERLDAGTDEAEASAKVRARLVDGDFSVVARRFIDDVLALFPFQCVAVAYCGLTYFEASDLTTRVQHVGPEPLISGVSLQDAVQVKELLLAIGVDAKVEERVAARSGRRAAIPEAARHEVWRRDGAECVDCGSRERLEFDHIIPVSRGGANTPRNIELRCESCNRTKAARI